MKCSGIHELEIYAQRLTWKSQNNRDVRDICSNLNEDLA